MADIRYLLYREFRLDWEEDESCSNLKMKLEGNQLASTFSPQPPSGTELGQSSESESETEHHNNGHEGGRET